MTQRISVRDHMTAIPQSIDIGASLSAAASLLRKEGLECVTVLDAGAVAGLLDARDLMLLQELGVSAHDVILRDLPLDDVYLTTPDAPLPMVARAMAIQRVSCAVVQDQQRVVGLLPWHAAVLGLTHAVSEVPAPAERSPSEIRRLILTEHANIRRLLRRVERAARKIIHLPLAEERDLAIAQQSALTLCTVMESHFELENQLLAPALEALDAWGQVRAERLRSEHRQQVELLHGFLRTLERVAQSATPAPVLASLVQELVDTIRADMQAEEQTLLRADLLCDDPTAVVVEAG